VEGRDRACVTECLGRLVLGGPAVTVGEQPVEVAAHGLVESSDPGDAALELCGRVHIRILKQNLIDITVLGF
jgi:hypothetical protein